MRAATASGLRLDSFGGYAKRSAHLPSYGGEDSVRRFFPGMGRRYIGAQRVRELALGGDTNRVARAIAMLRKDFDQPLRIEDMARELSMSTSSCHHHFKAVTAMTPLQFQK